jgi:multiple sugar transport system substrate-binding protein
VHDALVAEFNRDNPGIHVTSMWTGSSDHALVRALTAIAAGSYPDIVYLFGVWSAVIAKSPKVVTLNDMISRDPSFDWDDFWPATRRAATVDGRIIGVPALVDNLAIVYNKGLFDEIRIPHPSAAWTWNDFRAAAKALTDRAKRRYGWAFPADFSEDPVWHWEAMLWEAGGDVLTPDNRRAAFDSPAGRQALTMLADMARVDRSVFVDTGNAMHLDAFGAGRLGMLVTGPWSLTAFAHVDRGVQIMPAFVNHQTISGADNWVVLDNGDRRVAASWEFIRWLTATEQSARIGAETGTMPVRKSETGLPSYPAYLEKYPGVSTFVANMVNVVKSRPVIPAYADVSDALARAIVAVLLGQADAATALERAALEVDAVLDASTP